MEYEKKLRDGDHFVKPRTGSIPDDVACDCFESKISAAESKPNTPKFRCDSGNTGFRNIKLETSFLSKPTLPASVAPSSSLYCRRLKDTSSNQVSVNVSTPGVDSFSSVHSAPVGGAGVVLDLRVSVPFESHLKRLGSDGIDEEDEGPEESSPNYKSNSLPRNITRISGKICESHSCATTPDVLSSGFRENHQIRIRSFTAPSTPAGRDIESFIKAETKQGRKFAVKRLFPLDIEMVQDHEEREKSEDLPPSPPRSRDCPHSTPLYFASDCLSRDNSCTSSLGSLRTDKMTSRKTKSPKISRKSFSPGVRPPYCQAHRNSKHHFTAYSHMPQRSRTKDSLSSKLGSMQPLTSSLHCESPSAEGISSLTLYSPVIMDNNPLEIIGRGLCSTGKKLSSNSSLAPTTDGQSQSTECSIAPHGLKPTNLKSKIGSSFQLASSTNLKLKWRKRSPRPDMSSENSTSSHDKTQTSPSVLSRPCSGNAEMITCS